MGSLPSVSLPKSGGAIRELDEKLSISQSSWTASLTVPVLTSRARQAFGPEPSLTYDSGGGNGPFELGWSLSVAHNTRKTSRGLPLYDDPANSDVFIVSRAEDLVPLLVGGEAPSLPQRTVGGRTYHVTPYRPRVESGFVRIERWRDTVSGDVHWRTISRENVASLYGQDPKSRMTDPADATRIFTWLIDLSFDDRGNAISYVYKAEDRDICEDDAFSWHECIVDSGFTAAARVPNPFDEEPGPALIFADPTACIFLADMSGDGLTHLVRIRSGDVCYWPNLGCGRFGAKVAMDANPAFDYLRSV